MPSPADDPVTAAVAELYAGSPESFIARRGELATVARKAGDRGAAQAIGALRRPTRTAWIVNTLARADQEAPSRLAELGAALGRAQQAKDGRRLRELSAERGELIDALTARALDLAEVADPPPALRLEVSQTLTAALADPGVAAEFAAGTLTRAVQWSGFGVLPADAGADSDAEEPAAAPPRAKSAETGRATLKAAAAKPKPSRARTEATAPGQREGRAGQAQQRAEQAAAERATLRREQYAESERAAATAATAAAEAGAAEDRLEAEVRTLEQRLTEARSELTAARLRARRAESAERRARADLGRLSPPLTRTTAEWCQPSPKPTVTSEK